MTDREKQELYEIVRNVLTTSGGCPLGIKPETAHELISAADTWKTCRRSMLVGVITVVVGGIIAAIVAGI